MNMLIAIMSEIYDDVTENKDTNSIIERINLLTDYSIFLDYFDLTPDANFLFVVEKSSQDLIINTVEEKIDELAILLKNQ